jgi:2-polyprenyl-3-methyl-5-hydroxy-6-metoxy-1,4-benzoquinol methylase
MLEATESDFMSKIGYIISYISERNPIHAKKLRKSLPSLGEVYNRRAEEFLTKYESLLVEEGKNLHFAIDCYLKMLADITMETLRFLETGEYSSKSFEEVNRRVYGAPEVMEYYMHALLLSQFLWKHHYEMFGFFTEELAKRKGSVKNYLEIGGGHGLQVAEATKILGSDSQFTVVDISPTSLNIARRLVDDDSVNFVLSDIFQFKPETKFDFITLGEVLEHMEDPGALLNCVSDLLTDHGTLFVTTPANAPAIDHIYLFRNEDDIRKLIHDANLAVTNEFYRYAEDVDKEKADRYQITLHYGASLKKEANESSVKR